MYHCDYSTATWFTCVAFLYQQQMGILLPLVGCSYYYIFNCYQWTSWGVIINKQCHFNYSEKNYFFIDALLKFIIVNHTLKVKEFHNKRTVQNTTKSFKYKKVKRIGYFLFVFVSLFCLLDVSLFLFCRFRSHQERVFSSASKAKFHC